MARSPAETPIRGATSERAERTEIRNGERSGVAVRQVASPSASREGTPDPGRRTRTLVLVAVAVVLVAAGIAAVLVLNRGASDKSSTTPVARPSFTIDTAAPTTVDPQQGVRAAVIRDYLASLAAYDEASGLPDGRPPNPDLPALSAYMVGDQLTRVKLFIIGMKAGGLAALGPQGQFHPRVVSVQASTAIVQDCYTSSNHIVDAKTHALHDTPGMVTVGRESTLQFDAASGIWRTADSVRKPELCGAS